MIGQKDIGTFFKKTNTSDDLSKDKDTDNDRD